METAEAFLTALALLLLGCASSSSTVPGDPASLPVFEFAKLHGQTVALKVLDHRAEASDRAA